VTAPLAITSRDNPLLKELRKLASDGTAYRKTGRVWLEGEHLCSAYTARGLRADVVVFNDKNRHFSDVDIDKLAIKSIVISRELMAEISPLDSLADMGFVCSIALDTVVEPELPTVVLDRLQDPGNVGSILRSAAAFGFKQVVALKGCVALWAPKVVRAGMGAHFGLRLVESASLGDVARLNRPLAVTSSHQGQYLSELLSGRQLPSEINWALGHEGQGVCAELMAQASLHVRIAQPGGEESLNVAAAAAICLHASGTVHGNAAA
jgi:RNA methyltransferase, TrmH family